MFPRQDFSLIVLRMLFVGKKLEIFFFLASLKLTINSNINKLIFTYIFHQSFFSIGVISAALYSDSISEMATLIASTTGLPMYSPILSRGVVKMPYNPLLE